VDVIFLLLIFFIVTSDILPLKSLAIENPQLAKNAPAKLSHLLVVMDKDHVIYLGAKKEIIDMASLKEHLQQEIAALKAKSPDARPQIVLHVDRRVDYGAFLRLFATAQECSNNIKLSFKPKD
jgi:biopolymer transport protein ExbD